MNLRRWRVLAALFAAQLIGFVAAPAVQARDVTVAVAANFTEPAKKIAAAFKRATGNTAVLTFGSSGAIVTQIQHGAPFDLFLSADSERPAALEKDGLTVPASRFTYAKGQLVLYSARAGLVDPRGGVLLRGNFDKIAIADPALASYGEAALQTMRRMKVADKLAPKVVKGTSITQAYQFVATGAADLGFVARSQVATVKGGSRWLVPPSMHDPIEQQAVILKSAAGNPAAVAFARFLRSGQARAIIKRFGYGI